MAAGSHPEVWLRGPLPGFAPALMPVAHALLQAREDVERAANQLRHTAADSLDAAREVGRARLPSTVQGLLFHGAEHTTRHVGQLITTLKVVRGANSGM